MPVHVHLPACVPTPTYLHVGITEGDDMARKFSVQEKNMRMGTGSSSRSSRSSSSRNSSDGSGGNGSSSDAIAGAGAGHTAQFEAALARASAVPKTAQERKELDGAVRGSGYGLWGGGGACYTLHL